MVRVFRAILAAAVVVSSASFITEAVGQSGQAPAQETRPATGVPPQPAPFGGGRRSQTNELTDFSPKPPVTARTPEEEANGFMLPAGYRMELVAAEPDVINPTLIEFDGNGRMYVGEMISYMMDAEATREHDPISPITRWESTKGDGRYGPAARRITSGAGPPRLRDQGPAEGDDRSPG